MSTAVALPPKTPAGAAPPDRAPARPESAVPVWLAAAASLLLVLALYAAGKGTLLRIALPAGATLTGFALYLRRPVGYIHFTLWAWFLTPLVRRLVDWRMGFEGQNLVLLAPFLVSAIAGLTLVRERRSAGPVKLTPFLLCIGGIFYGFAVGVIRWRLGPAGAAPIGEVLYGLLNWLAPLLFGVHLYLRSSMYEEHTRAIQKSFLWAVLLLGAYGIYQYVAPLDWDKFWLEHILTDVGAESFGRPQAFSIRVWSTMNAPGPFAAMLMFGLIITLNVRSKFRLPASIAGYFAFALTFVRTAWLGWAVAFLYFAKATRRAVLLRTIALLVIAGVCLIPLAMNPSFSAVTDRFVTLFDVRHDESAQVRGEMYQKLQDEIVHHPFGFGLSNTQMVDGYALDSSLLQMFFSFGWLGTALFMSGVVMVAIPRRVSVDRTDQASVALRAIQLSFLLQSLAGNNFIGVTGQLFWIASALFLCAPGRVPVEQHRPKMWQPEVAGIHAS
jgi:hypothetical protein